jgi:hypothetical protein
MKTWLKIGLAVVGVAILAAVVIGLALGSRFEVHEEQVVDASPDTIHDYLTPLHLWREPVQKGIAKEDPTAVVTTDGPESGVGSMLRWSGEGIGEGWVKITQEDPDRGVWYEFGSGDETTAQASITYDERDEGTNLVVDCRGELDLVIGGYIAPFMEDKAGEAVAWGLQELKKEIESGTPVDEIFNEVYQFFD